MKLLARAEKDKKATTAARNTQEGMGENSWYRKLAGWYRKRYLGCSGFRLGGDEFGTVATHLASFYNSSEDEHKISQDLRF